ncbi:MAG TPA: HAD-IA family hydrolase [Candidatus Sulfotelmatobacter sp.]|nr:HAD-IA family hydrolase [Candidatus Sulfotelmatobacter sp.]
MSGKLPIELIIFDLDGTLTDSIPPAIAAIQKMLGQLGYPVKSAAEVHRYVGWGELPLITGSIGTEEEDKVSAAMRLYEKYYREEGLPAVPLYPHVKEILEYFKSKTKAIISNKKSAFIDILLKNHHLAFYFREVLGGDNAPCLKPDPCAILEMLKKYNVPKERALLVGDMTVDIETGRNAGIKTCGVTYGFDGKDKLAAAGPDFLIADLLELKSLIA